MAISSIIHIVLLFVGVILIIIGSFILVILKRHKERGINYRPINPLWINHTMSSGAAINDRNWSKIYCLNLLLKSKNKRS